MTYRYPGAQPFKTEEQHIFYGRKEDTNDLYQQILLESLVILHAKSGLGKSSLINAGLVPLAIEQNDFEPISIRFFAKKDEKTESPLKTTLATVEASCDLLEKIKPSDDSSLWYQIKSRQYNLGNRKGILLIFDQFEELFTYHPVEIAQFARQLSEALYVNVPQRYREKRKQGFEKNTNFLTATELAFLDEPIQLRVLFAIRSDRMSLLKKLKVWLPNILSADYELTPLNRIEAEEAILSPAYLKGDFITPIFDYQDEAIEYLLDFLSKKGKQPIESFQLQILCEYVEQWVVENKEKTLIEKSDLLNPDLILENYYLDKIAAITNPNEKLAARRFLEEGLIFEEEERRLTIYEGQIYSTYNISPALLRQLLDTHLIRSEPSLRGGYTYELSHDTLVKPVLKAKVKRVDAEEKATREQERLANEKALKEEIRKRKIANWLAAISIIFALLAIFTSIFAWHQMQRVEEQISLTNESANRAKRSALIAKAAQQEALIKAANALIAENQAWVAEKQAETNLKNFKQEQASRINQEITNLLERVEKLNKYPEIQLALLEVAKDKLAAYPDNNQLKLKLQELQKKIDQLKK